MALLSIYSAFLLFWGKLIDAAVDGELKINFERPNLNGI